MACILALSPSHTFGVTLVVDSVGDSQDANPGDGECSDTNGNCTLRAAIQEANALPGAHVIQFNIPGTGPHTISPASSLPAISKPVIIDGYTQPGASPNTLSDGNDAVLMIELSGANAGSAHGLILSLTNCVVRGLAINRFYWYGIEMLSKCHTIEGNFIGTDITGSVALGNGLRGLDVNSSSNQIGGVLPSARNVVSGNGRWGIRIENAQKGNIVQGNYVGTSASGLSALPNGQGDESGGIMISLGTGNLIGGSAPGAGNLVAGNNGNGIEINRSDADNMVRGNYVGVDVTGTNALGNLNRGVYVMGSLPSSIGGPGLGDGNVISGNTYDGVMIENSRDTLVEGNIIGADATGTKPLGNGRIGILVALNGSSGSTLRSNIVAYNQGQGVGILSFPSYLWPTNVLVSGNSIHDNDQLGIDLAHDLYYGWGSQLGVTTNDPGDADTGPNGFQNYPVLQSAILNGNTLTACGSLNSQPSTSYVLEFFINRQCDASGFGEGETYLGATNVVTDINGNASFIVVFSSMVDAGSFLTATATDPNRNTSEFSACVPVTPLQIASIAREGNNVRLTWMTWGGKTNFVQATGIGNGGYSTNFSDISPLMIITGTGAKTTNYLDVGAITNWPARYYRVRQLN